MENHQIEVVIFITYLKVKISSIIAKTMEELTFLSMPSQIYLEEADYEPKIS